MLSQKTQSAILKFQDLDCYCDLSPIYPDSPLSGAFSVVTYSSSAECSESIRAWSLKGLFKKLIAPARNARSRVFSSP